jgi:hypothetical protein
MRADPSDRHEILAELVRTRARVAALESENRALLARAETALDCVYIRGFIKEGVWKDARAEFLAALAHPTGDSE